LKHGAVLVATGVALVGMVILLALLIKNWPHIIYLNMNVHETFQMLNSSDAGETDSESYHHFNVANRSYNWMTIASGFVLAFFALLCMFMTIFQVLPVMIRVL
jgi:uncharacterized membrane protein